MHRLNTGHSYSFLRQKVSSNRAKNGEGQGQGQDEEKPIMSPRDLEFSLCILLTD